MSFDPRRLVFSLLFLSLACLRRETIPDDDPMFTLTPDNQKFVSRQEKCEADPHKIWQKEKCLDRQEVLATEQACSSSPKVKMGSQAERACERKPAQKASSCPQIEACPSSP